MNTEEIIKAVSDAHPAVMNKTAQILAITERLHPECMPDIIADFETVCSVVNEKVAADKVTGLKSFAIGVGGTAAAGLLGAIATDLYDAAKRGLSKGRNFQRIMEANPHLKREFDKNHLSVAYTALHRFAPDFTSDPLVGGALLKNIAELPHLSPNTIMNLIGAEKNLGDAKGRHFGEMSKLSPYLVPNEQRSEAHPSKGEPAKNQPGE